MSLNNSVVLMNQARISRALIRIAYQIHEECHGDRDILLIGLNQRGHNVARKLGSELEKILKAEVSVLQISVHEEEKKTANKEISFRDKYVVIVDDVIFSGRTIYDAIQKINRYGEPKRMMLAVLIDRGHRNYPIEAQFVGMTCPTKLDEHVSVNFSGEGEVTEVMLGKE